jgi:hypothetical protein
MPLALPRPGKGVGTMTMFSTAFFTSSTDAKLASTHRPKSCGAIAREAFSFVASPYWA